MIRYVLLILLWGAWCFFHSFLITPAVIGFARKYWGSTYRYYRILYNITALATLTPVLVYTYSMRGQPIFRWEGPFRIIQALLAIFAVVLFIGGSRRYDLAHFLGIRQLREDSACSVPTQGRRLATGGILSMVRHPWYVGGMLIVWVRNPDGTAVLTNLLITGYLLIGAVLEERKLAAEFGAEYTEYRQRVSMLLPIKWGAQKLKGLRVHR